MGSATSTAVGVGLGDGVMLGEFVGLADGLAAIDAPGPPLPDSADPAATRGAPELSAPPASPCPSRVLPTATPRMNAATTGKARRAPDIGSPSAAAPSADARARGWLFHPVTPLQIYFG